MYPLGQLLQFTCDALSLNFPAWHGKHSVSSSPLSMNFAAGHDSLCQRKNGENGKRLMVVFFSIQNMCTLSLLPHDDLSVLLYFSLEHSEHAFIFGAGAF